MKVVVSQGKNRYFIFLSGICFAAILGFSSLISAKVPEEGLQLAQKAEKLLAANNVNEAVEVLESCVSKYPDAPAFSLRLAQVYDNNNELGKALFYYRKYIAFGGGRGFDEAMARSSTLELMPNVKEEASAFAKSKNETTKAVPPAQSKVLNSINVEKPDGTLIPLKGEEDLNTVISKGINSIETPKPAAATITPSSTPIVINPQLVENVRKKADQPVTYETKSSSQKMDEDALIAQKLLGKGNEAKTVDIKASPVVGKDVEVPLSIEAKLAHGVQVAENSFTPASDTRFTQPPQSRSSNLPSSNIAYTKPEENLDSPKAKTFFNTKSIGGNSPKIFVANAMPAGVVTISIVPEDEKPAEQAILMPGESKMITLKPDYYEFSANVSTTDYPPITLMNSQFRIKFQPGTQYSRRFDIQNNEKVN